MNTARHPATPTAQTDIVKRRSPAPQSPEQLLSIFNADASKQKVYRARQVKSTDSGMGKLLLPKLELDFEHANQQVISGAAR